MDAVVIEDLTYMYPTSEKPVLQHISLKIECGEFVLVVGNSGCGKTTLARCICGLIPHVFQGRFTGKVFVNGKNTLEHPVYELARDVGLVFQNPESQFCTLTVEDEVAFGPENLGLSREEIGRRVEQSLRLVEMEQYRYDPLSSLSYGQKQRIAIASILSMSQDIIVLDEPISNIDAEAAKDILKIFANLKVEYGKTIILIEHRIPKEVLTYIDKLVVMDDGKIVYYGPLQQSYIRRLLRETNLKDSFVEDKGIKKENPISEELLKLEKILYKYKEGQFTLKVDDLAVYKGEILAIIGGNGSGKTTLAKLIAGLIKPERGRIKRYGKIRVGMVFQNPEVQLFNATVHDEVAFSFIGKLAATKTIEELLEEVDLSSKKKDHPQSLSQGEKQRLALAAILANEPDILILDEPTTGQDRYHLTLITNRLRSLKNSGKTVLLITHDLELVNEVADRVLVLKNGKIYGMFRRERQAS